jgi:hypothetical protein
MANTSSPSKTNANYHGDPRHHEADSANQILLPGRSAVEITGPIDYETCARCTSSWWFNVRSADAWRPDCHVCGLAKD